MNVVLYQDGRLISNRTIFGSDLKLTIRRESNEMFRRSVLDGDFTFLKDDYLAIHNASLESKFHVDVYEDDVLVAKGEFAKTDCEFDVDNSICKVKATNIDEYTKLLSGINNSYDLINLAPPKRGVQMWKRAILQLYCIRDTKVTNVIGNMSYEVDAQSGVEEMDEKEIMEKYHFSSIKNDFQIICSFDSSLYRFNGTYRGWFKETDSEGKIWREDGEYYWKVNPKKVSFEEYILYNANGTIAYAYGTYGRISINRDSEDIYVLNGTTLTIVGTRNIWNNDIYARILFDEENPTEIVSEVYPVMEDDICTRNMNYRFVMEGNIPILGDLLITSYEVQDEPTKWGVDGNGKYFVQPQSRVSGGNVIPIGWNRWIPMSMWFDSNVGISEILDKWNALWSCKDCIYLEDAINYLLKEIDPSITFEGTSEYSNFLYKATNPITKEQNLDYFITPITNVKKTYYNQAARKGTITLRQILDFLKNGLQCYWWVENGKLRIEHITWFKRGGNYEEDTRVPLMQINSLFSSKYGKNWGYGQNKSTYDKDILPKRYEFGWDNDCFEPFNGVNLDVNNAYVGTGTENARISNFISDIDLIVSAPDAMSDDAFAVFGAYDFCVPISDIRLLSDVESPIYVAQNGMLSFLYMEMNYWRYNLSGEDVTASEVGGKISVFGTKNARKQRVTLPCDAEIVKTDGLIGTAIGDGEIDSVSYNFDSKSATFDLNLDTLGEEKIIINPNSLSFSRYGESLTFTIKTKQSWSFVLPTWLTANKTSGVGNDTITLTASRNSGGFRLASIVVHGEFSSAKVDAYQETIYNYAYFVPNQSTITSFGNGGGQGGAGVEANVSWSIISSPWISVTQYSNGITYSVLANNTGLNRDGYISIVSGGVAVDTLSITQTASAHYINVENQSFDNEGGVVSVSIDTDIKPLTSIVYEVSDDWLSYYITNHHGINSFYLQAQPNELGTSREGSVKMFYQGVQYAEMLVYQGEGESYATFRVTPLTITRFGGNAGNSVVGVRANVEWSVTSSASWLTITETLSDAVKYAVSQNTGENREAYLRLWVDGVMVSELKITQSNEVHYVTTDPSSLSFNSDAQNAQVSISSDIAPYNLSFEPSDDWIDVEMTASNLLVSVFANTSATQRSGSIRITYNSVEYATISVTQGGFAPYANFVRLSGTKTFFNADGGRSSIGVRANTEWSASARQSWITTTRSGEYLIYEVAPNSGASRNTIIDLYVNGVAVDYISIEQGAETHYILLNRNTLSMSGTSQSKRVEFSTDVPINQIQTSVNGNWITNATIVDSGSEGLGYLTFQVAENLVAERTGTITLYYGGVAYDTLTITQSRFAVVLEFDRSPMPKTQFPKGGGSALAYVTSNVPWTASSGASWLRVQSSSNAVAYSASINPTSSSRSTYISLYYNGVVMDGLQIGQDYTYHVDITQPPILNNDAQSVPILITTDLDIYEMEFISNSPWLTWDIRDGVLYVEVTRNLGTDRTGHISVSFEGVSYGTINVTQALEIVTIISSNKSSVNQMTYTHSQTSELATIEIDGQKYASGEDWLWIQLVTADAEVRVVITASSESGYDYGWLNTTNVYTNPTSALLSVSGTESKYKTLDPNTEYYIGYKKDSSQTRNNDKITFTFEVV